MYRAYSSSLLHAIIKNFFDPNNIKIDEKSYRKYSYLLLDM